MVIDQEQNKIPEGEYRNAADPPDLPDKFGKQAKQGNPGEQSTAEWNHQAGAAGNFFDPKPSQSSREGNGKSKKGQVGYGDVQSSTVSLPS
jgi:hypothetical protein